MGAVKFSTPLSQGTSIPTDVPPGSIYSGRIARKHPNRPTYVRQVLRKRRTQETAASGYNNSTTAWILEHRYDSKESVNVEYSSYREVASALTGIPHPLQGSKRTSSPSSVNPGRSMTGGGGFSLSGMSHQGSCFLVKASRPIDLSSSKPARQSVGSAG